MKIEELNLNTRTYNALRRNNITDVEQIAELDDDQLLAMKFFGYAALQEVKLCLDVYVHHAPCIMTVREIEKKLLYVLRESEIPDPEKECIKQFLGWAFPVWKQQGTDNFVIFRKEAE